MIVSDTHIWIWLADGSERLSDHHRRILEEQGSEGIGVSVISCWEVAKLVEYGRLRLACSVEEWIDGALALPQLQLFGLTPRIAISSTRLPGNFHRDPADQLIVATAREYDCELLTSDEKILKYAHVRTQ